MIVAFDFDGVIVDSKETVLRAYAAAGYPMPEGCFGVPGRKWLVEVAGLLPDKADEVYAKKTEAYRTLITTAPLLPPVNVADQLASPILLTSADGQAVGACESRVGVPWLDVYTDCSADQKTQVLKGFWPHHGVYIDDLPWMRYVAENANWKFIHYDGQSARELWKQLGELMLP